MEFRCLKCGQPVGLGCVVVLLFVFWFGGQGFLGVRSGVAMLLWVEGWGLAASCGGHSQDNMQVFRRSLQLQMGCTGSWGLSKKKKSANFFLFRPKPSTSVRDCSALQTHGLRQYITVPWYLPSVLAERGHKVVGELSDAACALPTGHSCLMAGSRKKRANGRAVPGPEFSKLPFPTAAPREQYDANILPTGHA